MSVPSEMPKYRLSGDEGVGQFEPADIRPVSFRRLPPDRLARLALIPGLTPTTSDVLDEMGWQMTVPVSTLPQRHRQDTVVVGQALTLKYLPARRHILYPGQGDQPPMLAHHIVLRLASPGDVMVIDASGVGPISTMGGIAARAAAARDLAGVVVDGGVRDLDELLATALPLWSRYVTPRAGKGRLEAVAVNSPVLCGGVQVRAGDLVIADSTGICFVPIDIVDPVIDRVLEVAESERATARPRDR
jgi:regulator of RNase E activity RraA